MDFQDRAPLEKIRRLSDGRLAAIAKVARSGVYQYDGKELGRPDLGVVNVYRPESEVFNQASLASFAHKSVTLGHPTEAVTADNWRQYSVGYAADKIARDGDYIEIPLMLADAAAVAAVEDGTAKELSAGYRCELVWGDGVAPDGQRYAATQRGIVANHIALVSAGRAGARCSIGDARSASAPTSIDEALRLKFAEMAKTQGVSVEEMLSAMQQSDIENTVADVAKAFVTAQAGKGIASTYAVKDVAALVSTLRAGVSLADAERSMIIAKAEAQHRLRHAYLASPPAFTDQQATAALDAAIGQKAAVSTSLAASQASTATLKAQHDADREARKQQLRDGWRR